MNLTPQQEQALQQGYPIPFHVGGKDCVIVRQDVYDQVKDLLSSADDATHEELRHMLARSAAANGWDEPEMDDYDHYDEHRKDPCP